MLQTMRLRLIFHKFKATAAISELSEKLLSQFYFRSVCMCNNYSGTYFELSECEYEILVEIFILLLHAILRTCMWKILNWKRKSFLWRNFIRVNFNKCCCSFDRNVVSYFLFQVISSTCSRFIDYSICLMITSFSVVVVIEFFESWHYS